MAFRLAAAPMSLVPHAPDMLGGRDPSGRFCGDTMLHRDPSGRPAFLHRTLQTLPGSPTPWPAAAGDRAALKDADLTSASANASLWTLRTHLGCRRLAPRLQPEKVALSLLASARMIIQRWISGSGACPQPASPTGLSLVIRALVTHAQVTCAGGAAGSGGRHDVGLLATPFEAVEQECACDAVSGDAGGVAGGEARSGPPGKVTLVPLCGHAPGPHALIAARRGRAPGSARHGRGFPHPPRCIGHHGVTCPCFSRGLIFFFSTHWWLFLFFSKIEEELINFPPPSVMNNYFFLVSCCNQTCRIGESMRKEMCAPVPSIAAQPPS